MPKLPATLITVALVCYLFWIDRKNKDTVSHAIWIPFILMFFNGSRPLSFWLDYWFHLGFYSQSATASGNLIELSFNTILIVAAAIVLHRRKLNWSGVFRDNTFICLYFVFGTASIFWSDNPFVSFKRFVKTWGTAVIVLVILTEERPYIALGTILRRLSFIFLPFSVLFIKYYPTLGRTYHNWAGSQMFTGVSDGKNGLGTICLITGIYYAWNLLFGRLSAETLGHRLHRSVYIILLPILAWLFYKANSATSLVCMVVAAGILVFGRQRPAVRAPRSILYVSIGSIVLYFVLEMAFDLQNSIISLLGRRPDLTTRVPMWRELISMVSNPLIGFGFESFWLGRRLAVVQERWGTIVQAHNGYIETYLNLGYIGVFLLVLWILAGFKKAVNNLTISYLPAMLTFSLLVVICLYNYTEATFYGKASMWVLFLMTTINLSSQNRVGISKVFDSHYDLKRKGR